MRTFIFLISVLSFSTAVVAQFAPPAGQTGTTAIHKDSTVFTSWANGCSVIRGYQNSSIPSLGVASAGDSTMATGKSGDNPIVSLGDGGMAILTFPHSIKNGSGWDFAVFENGFDDSFLELAFVEVSSDGTHFFRFPATSAVQDTLQTGSFGLTDATKINNLAGKYRAGYGTPFDLEELAGLEGLNINRITHIKIIDAVGCIQDAYASRDQFGHKINDPWPTAFPSGGFDLDAVGVIHNAVGIEEDMTTHSFLTIYPNPVHASTSINFYLRSPSEVTITMSDVAGRQYLVLPKQPLNDGWKTIPVICPSVPGGLYFLHLISNEGVFTTKMIIENE